MSKSRCWSRVGQVVSGHIDCLYGGDGTTLCRGDALLHCTHLAGQCRLIAYGRRHTSQQGRHLRTSLSETEDVVDEEHDVSSLSVLTTMVAELLSHRQTREGDRGTCPRRLVHLTIDQRSLRLLKFFRVNKTQVPLALVHSLSELLAITDNA